MKKIILGCLLGGFIYFLAGSLAWMVMPWHQSVIKKLPEENLIRDTLKVVISEPGFYYFPSERTETGHMDQKSYNELFKSGPTGALICSPGGKLPMSPVNFVIGIIVGVITALIGLIFLTLSQDRVQGYFKRVALVVIMGVLGWWTVHIPNWNWMGYPLDFTLVLLLDTIFCFGLMGLVLPKFIPEKVCHD